MFSNLIERYSMFQRLIHFEYDNIVGFGEGKYRSKLDIRHMLHVFNVYILKVEV